MVAVGVAEIRRGKDRVDGHNIGEGGVLVAGMGPCKDQEEGNPNSCRGPWQLLGNTLGHWPPL